MYSVMNFDKDMAHVYNTTRFPPTRFAVNSIGLHSQPLATFKILSSTMTNFPYRIVFKWNCGRQTIWGLDSLAHWNAFEIYSSCISSSLFLLLSIISLHAYTRKYLFIY